MTGFIKYEGPAGSLPPSCSDSPGYDGESMALLQFPADRRAADIRRCAEALRNLHGEEANRFWRSEMARFAAALRDQGEAEAEISRQAGLFMHAVQIELENLYGEIGLSA